MSDIKEEPKPMEVAATEEASNLKRPLNDESKAEEEPDAKRCRVDLMATVKKQMEYYLSDDNLKADKFFYEKIKEEESGYLSMDVIMQCRKIEALNITKEDVKEAVSGSETVEMKDDLSAIRRKDNKALPEFVGRKNFNKKPKTGHEGGCMMKFSGINEALEWGDVKRCFKDRLIACPHLKEQAGEKVFIDYCSVKKGENKDMVYMSISPFEDDLEFFKKHCQTEEWKTMEVKHIPAGEEAKADCHTSNVTVSICEEESEELKNAIEEMPQVYREKRSRHEKNRNRGKGKGKGKKGEGKKGKGKGKGGKGQMCSDGPTVFKVADQQFGNLNDLRTKVKAIMSARSDGEELKSESNEFNLISSLMDFHPKGQAKKKNMKTIVVDQSGHGESNRCFHVVYNDGSRDNFSMVKIYEEMKRPGVVHKSDYEKPAAETVNTSASEAETSPEKNTTEVKTEA